MKRRTHRHAERLNTDTGQTSCTADPSVPLPGGVVEAGESPARAAVREIKEELGLDIVVLRIVGVDYRRPRSDDFGSALRFVFDGGSLSDHQLSTIQLPPDELRAWGFVELAELDDYVIPVLARRLRHVLTGHVYLEEGEPLG